LNIVFNALASGQAQVATLTATGDVEEAGAGSLSIYAIQGSAAGFLLNGPNQFTSIFNITSGADGFSVSNGGTLNLSGAINAVAGPVNVSTTSGDIQVFGSVTTTGTFAVHSAGRLSQFGTSAVNVGTLSAVTGSDVLLSGGHNHINTLGQISAGGGIRISDQVVPVIVGPISWGVGGESLTTPNGLTWHP
jgi:hypothetical protein